MTTGLTAIPRYDDSNKEECAIWISRIDQIATSTVRRPVNGATQLS